MDWDALFSFLTYQLESFEEAFKEAKWMHAMNEEIEAIENNETWDLVDLLKGKTSIIVKWVYMSKLIEK